jgi:hypothetical protein
MLTYETLSRAVHYFTEASCVADGTSVTSCAIRNPAVSRRVKRFMDEHPTVPFIGSRFDLQALDQDYEHLLRGSSRMAPRRPTTPGMGTGGRAGRARRGRPPPRCSVLLGRDPRTRRSAEGCGRPWSREAWCHPFIQVRRIPPARTLPQVPRPRRAGLAPPADSPSASSSRAAEVARSGARSRVLRKWDLSPGAGRTQARRGRLPGRCWTSASVRTP